MRILFAFTLRLLAAVWPSLTLKLSNALRIRGVTNALFSPGINTRYYSVNMRVDTREWIGYFIYVGRCYECVVLEIIRKYAPLYKTFFDVGSNIGLHALVFASSNRQSQVFPFEPIPDLYTKLEANIALNPELKHQITPICAGLADKTDLLKFAYKHDPRSRGEASLIIKENDPQDAIFVNCYSVLDVTEKLKVWPDFMKIDVEGAEVQVLESLVECVSKGKSAPDLLLEVHSWMFSPNEKVHSKRILDLLKNMNYHVWNVVELSDDKVLQEFQIERVEIQPSPEVLGYRSMLLASTDPKRFQSFTPDNP